MEKQLLLTEDNLSQKTATMVESDGEEKKDEEKPVMDETEAVESHPKEGSMEEGEEGQVRCFSGYMTWLISNQTSIGQVFGGGCKERR